MNADIEIIYKLIRETKAGRIKWTRKIEDNSKDNIELNIAYECTTKTGAGYRIKLEPYKKNKTTIVLYFFDKESNSSYKKLYQKDFNRFLSVNWLVYLYGTIQIEDAGLKSNNNEGIVAV